MKSFYLTCLFTFCLAGSGLAQGLNLNLYGGYVFDDRFDSYFDLGRYYEGKLKGGFQWGAGLEYLTNPLMGIELVYIRQDSEAPTNYVTDVLPRYTVFEVDMNYIMLGGIRHLPIDGPLEGNAGLMAGMVIIGLDNPDNGRSDSATKFAWGVRGGLTYWASEVVGIKLQAQLLSAVQSMGGGLYFGTGGAGVGLNSYSTIFQFTLGGGISYKIK